jgi:hypothetical protein
LARQLELESFGHTYGRFLSGGHIRLLGWRTRPMKAQSLRGGAHWNFRRQGVSEGQIMKLCGWKTRAMFDRYNIIDEIDLAQAVATRFNGKVTAKSGTPATDGASLSCSPASSAA